MIVFARTCEVVHKQVASHLISYNIQLACVTMKYGGNLTRYPRIAALITLNGKMVNY